MTGAPPGLPERFDRYRIEALVGQGGMGRVYRAYDTRLRRTVALKVLREDRTQAPAAALLREARAAAALKHRNIVALYDAGEVDGTPFLTMEWIEGSSLRAKVGDPRVPMGERLRWLAEIAAALSAAHATGLVHRDIKPENVIVGADGVARVLDFGLAQAAGDETSVTTRDAAAPEGRPIACTPRYAAPEQLAGAPLTAAADQYAWGVVAYELCAGVHPAAVARGASNDALARGGLTPPGDINAEVPAAVSALIVKALDERPPARHADMNAIVAALSAVARASSPVLPGATESAGRGLGGEEATAREVPLRAAQDDEETVSTEGSPARIERAAPSPARRGTRIAVMAAVSMLLVGIGSAVTLALVRGREVPHEDADAGATAAPSARAAVPAPIAANAGGGNSASPVMSASVSAAPAADTAGAPTSSVPTAASMTASPRATSVPTAIHASNGGACPAGLQVNLNGVCRKACAAPADCSESGVCIRGVCADCSSGSYRGPRNACFDVCGAGGSCAGKAWPGSVCTTWGARRLCIPPGF
ncbi:serine/threonine protein kinase [Minicystis rosea]|nr:serine/threonine protein kinase [Minicystis rosea]